MISAELLSILQVTVVVALAATLVMLPPGMALAWWLARSQSWLKAPIETLVTLPLVLPPVATGFLLLRLLGRRGWFGALLDRAGVDIIFTWKALVIAMVVMGLPLVVRSARAGFEQGTRRFEQMAETLGAGPLRVFLTISLPLARRSVLAGALLGFSRALGEFGASMVIAGSIPWLDADGVACHVRLPRDRTRSGRRNACSCLTGDRLRGRLDLEPARARRSLLTMLDQPRVPLTVMAQLTQGSFALDVLVAGRLPAARGSSARQARARRRCSR